MSAVIMRFVGFTPERGSLVLTRVLLRQPPILLVRGSIAEMIVPTDPKIRLTAITLDLGEYGVGMLATTLTLGSTLGTSLLRRLSGPHQGRVVTITTRSACTRKTSACNLGSTGLARRSIGGARREAGRLE